MSRTHVAAVIVALLVASSCGGGDSCDPWACDDQCQSQGYTGGLCESGGCRCVGTADTSSDPGVDPGADPGPDTGADPGGDATGFAPTPGTQAAVDRTEPCPASDLGEWRQAPADTSVVQSCLPNYDIWAPVVCGTAYGLPECTCNASRCLAGEAAKPIDPGAFCLCLNMCTVQATGATCGASGERECIPVDDSSGTQVWICGGLP